MVHSGTIGFYGYFFLLVINGTSVCLPVRLSVRHARALWQNERTYFRYFHTVWKGITDRRMDGHNYNPKYRASIAASSGKNFRVFFKTHGWLWLAEDSKLSVQGGPIKTASSHCCDNQIQTQIVHKVSIYIFRKVTYKGYSLLMWWNSVSEWKSKK